MCQYAVATPGFEQGVEAYNGGQYQPALSLFTQELLSNPEEPMAHYYAGLCFHQLNHYAEATREYNWVLTHSQDPELIKRVQLGLQVLSRYPAAAPYAFQTPGSSLQQPWSQTAQHPGAVPGYARPVIPGRPSPGAPGSGYASETAANGSYQRTVQQAGQSQSASSFSGGEVLDFYTKWCGWCKKFSPMFHKAEHKYEGKLVFKSIDAEDPSNKALAQSFKLKGYPTIIFLDANGKYLGRIDGAPQSMQEFETEINKAYPDMPAI
jgi:thiol-disulfide isomerase/thioredoxin